MVRCEDLYLKDGNQASHVKPLPFPTPTTVDVVDVVVRYGDAVFVGGIVVMIILLLLMW
jgi:hypothetical protein